MEPPICEMTGEAFDPADGRRVRFLATDAGRAFDEAVRSGLTTGDSPDEAWFSARLKSARELRPIPMAPWAFPCAIWNR